MEQLIYTFLVKHKYAITYTALKNQLISHPTYDSLKSVSDTLDFFEIENLIANVPKDALNSLPNNFLALLKMEEQQDHGLVYVDQSNSKKISVTDQDNKKHSISTQDFKEKWNGTILAIEKATAPSFGFHFNTERYLLFFALILFCFFLTTKPTWLAVASYILSVAGLWIGVLIVKESFGLHSAGVAKVCNQLAKSSCDAVITSSSAILYKKLSLSDAVLVYFATTTLYLVFFGFQPLIFTVLSIAVLPVIGYTIFAQRMILKNWCALCLIISFVLLTQGALLFVLSEINTSFIFHYGFGFILISAICAISWVVFKTMFTDKQRLEKKELESLKMKKNTDVFKTLLLKNSPIETQSVEGIVFGNLSAPIQVTAITNPNCSFCKEAFLGYKQLLKLFPDTIRVKLVLLVNHEDQKNEGTRIANQLINVYNSRGKSKAFDALADWFVTKDLKKWSLKYGDDLANTHIDALAHNTIWCEENEILYTPETIINGYKKPSVYKVEELQFFIEYLSKISEKPILGPKNRKTLI
ncbi:vitamin K epoxide reductase family protein [Aquimarina sp. M1]